MLQMYIYNLHAVAAAVALTPCSKLICKILVFDCPAQDQCMLQVIMSLNLAFLPSWKILCWIKMDT